MKIHEYNEMMSYLTRRPMSMGGRVGFDNGGLVQKDFIELYNKFSGGSDQEFAEFIKEQTGVELKPKTINERRRRANLKIKIKEGQSLRGTAPRLADNEVLTEAKKLGIDTKGKDIKKLRKLISSKRLVEKRRTDPVAKEKRNVAEREYKQKVKERRKVDPEFDLAFKRKIKNYPSRKNMYVDMVPYEKNPKGLLYKDLTEQAMRYQKGALKNSHIQFLNPNETRPTGISKAQAIKFIDTKVLDKNGKPKIITFDNVTKHIDDNQKLYGIDSKSVLAEYDKKITINKSGLRNDFNKIIYGDTYDQATTMGKQKLAPFHVHHTAGRGANAFNVQFAVGSDNMTENGLRSILNREFKDAKNFGEKRKAVKKYLNNVPKNLEVRLKKTPYGTRETLTQITERISPELRKLMSIRSMGKEFKPGMQPDGRLVDLPGGNEKGFLGGSKAAKGLLKGLQVLGQPSIAAAFAADELAEGNIKTAGASLLAPELVGSAAPKGTSLLSKAGRLAMNPFGRAARAFTPVGLATIGAGGLYDVYKEFERRQALTDEERLDEDLEAQEKYDEMMVGAADGGLITGRMGFAEGPKDPSRRKFIKIMGGLASLPLVGKYFKLAEPLSKAAPVATESVKLGFDKFMVLVNKIKTLGDDVTPQRSTIEREKITVYQGKDGSEYELIEDLTTGNTRVTKDKPGMATSGDKSYDTIDNRTVMEYTKGETIPGKKKGIKVADEYDEYEQVAGVDGTFDDVDDVRETIVKEIEDELK